MRCRRCGTQYDDFRTGLTYFDVYHQIYGRKWKRRNGVLGYWHQLKLEMWTEHKRHCGESVQEVPREHFTEY